jgi:hypothetical protein
MAKQFPMLVRPLGFRFRSSRRSGTLKLWRLDSGKLTRNSAAVLLDRPSLRLSQFHGEPWFGDGVFAKQKKI